MSLTRHKGCAIVTARPLLGVSMDKNNVVQLSDHARASVKPKTPGSACCPTAPKASQINMKWSAGISLRVRQLTTADAPTPVKRAVLVGPPKASITASTDVSIPPFSSQIVKMSSLHVTAVENLLGVAFNGTMAESLKSLASRLKMTREALELSAAELCRIINCKQNRWSQYEGGDRKITLAVANSLCDQFGLSLDWIYRGNPALLPHALRAKMRQSA